MTPERNDLCHHCALPLGAWPYEKEAEAQTRCFCCYGCFVAWQAVRGGGDESAAAGFLIRLGVGAFLAMNIMLFSLMLYADGLTAGAELLPVFHGLLWILTTPVLVILGGPFFREACSELSAGRFSPSLLIALGSGAAYLYSAIATWQGGDRVYFDTAAMVLVLFTLGRYLEASGRARATRSLRPMVEAREQTVTRVTGDAETSWPLAEVEIGMTIRVAPGERVLVDGVVREGVSQAEEAYLTGESRPVAKQAGSQVLAGSINGEGELLVEAKARGLESRWMEICHDIRTAIGRPSRAQGIADRVARHFVPVVIAVAAGTVWFHLQAGSIPDALLAGLAVLVVACPCALGLAAPLATSMALASLARRGILARSGAALEALAGVRTVALDKTGTLTVGRPRCVEIVSDGAATETLLRRGAAVARASRHPLAEAIRDAAAGRGIAAEAASAIEVVPGMGIRGRLGKTTVYVGSPRWFVQQHWAIPESLATSARDSAENGRPLALVGWGGAARGLFVFDDEIHPHAVALVRSLGGAKLKAIVLSGDGEAQTARLCRSLRIEDWHSELSPEAKQRILCRLSAESGPFAMVGDGVNDSLAMLAAAVGIAAGRTADLARETADIVLPPDRIDLLPCLIRIARRTRRTIVANLAWAFAYNGVAVALAATGLLRPVVAAALMAGSSILVSGNTVAASIATPIARRARLHRHDDRHPVAGSTSARAAMKRSNAAPAIVRD